MPKGSKGGKRGKSKAQVHKVFSNRIRDLQQQAVKMADSVTSGAQRIWQIPSGFKGDLSDPAVLHEPAFDRTEINTDYELVMQDASAAGTIGDVIALKHQIAYVAAEEQAFRLRHLGLTRAICHAAGRRYGHGYGRSLIGVREQVERAIAAGGAT